MTTLENFFDKFKTMQQRVMRYKDISRKWQEERAYELQKKLIELADRHLNNDSTQTLEARILSYQTEKTAITDLIHNENYWYYSMHIGRDLLNAANQMPPIINTPLGEKIKKIAKI